MIPREVNDTTYQHGEGPCQQGYNADLMVEEKSGRRAWEVEWQWCVRGLLFHNKEFRLFLGGNGESDSRESGKSLLFRKVTLAAFSAGAPSLLPQTRSLLGLNNTPLSRFSLTSPALCRQQLHWTRGRRAPSWPCVPPDSRTVSTASPSPCCLGLRVSLHPDPSAEFPLRRLLDLSSWMSPRCLTSSLPCTKLRLSPCLLPTSPLGSPTQ